jgi:hypothetical protein
MLTLTNLLYYEIISLLPQTLRTAELGRKKWAVHVVGMGKDKSDVNI